MAEMEELQKEMQFNLKKAFMIHAAMIATVLLFLLMYFYINSADVRHLLIYLLMSLGLYFSYYVPLSGILINSLCLVLLLTTASAKNYWPCDVGLGLMLVITMTVPMYFSRLYRLEKEVSATKILPAAKKVKALEERAAKSEATRNTLEKEIEKINQLYLLGRELVEHMDLNEVVDHLQRAVLKRPGVRSVSIFSWEKSAWTPLFFSQPELKEEWIGLVKKQDALFKEKSFRVIQTPGWIQGQSVVFWPVRLDKTLLAGIFLTTDPNMADTYLEEGKIFIPQISLGLRRTRLFEEVEERSREDGLTGLYLRRYFIERLQAEIQRAKRYSTTFSLLMMDLDDFKKVNDTYGHLKGDEVLSLVAWVFKQCTRPGDLICRYGGEEFAILLPLATREQTMVIADKIIKGVEATRFSVPSEPSSKFSIQISIGVSYFPVNESALIPSADKALYWVKAHGKNGVKEFGELTIQPQ
jgi:diguanylate cyclase (GGDEF)-like protein